MCVPNCTSAMWIEIWAAFTSLAEPKNSITLKTFSTALTGYGKWNIMEDITGFNFFNAIVAVHSSNALKATGTMTLGWQSSCSPMVHKVSSVLEATSHCGSSWSMDNQYESILMDVTQRYWERHTELRDRLRQGYQYGLSAAEQDLTRKGSDMTEKDLETLAQTQQHMEWRPWGLWVSVFLHSS